MNLRNLGASPEVVSIRREGLTIPFQLKVHYLWTAEGEKQTQRYNQPEWRKCCVMHSHQKQARNHEYICVKTHTTIHMCKGYLQVLYLLQLILTMILISKRVKGKQDIKWVYCWCVIIWVNKIVTIALLQCHDLIENDKGYILVASIDKKNPSYLKNPEILKQVKNHRYG